MAFGPENLSAETRDMLLYGQLQEGLSYTLMESPSVSGSKNYRELCVAAKKEERRLAELKKKQQYLKSDRSSSFSDSFNKRSLQKNYNSTQKSGVDWNKHKAFGKQQSLRCYLCDSPNHLARDCHARKTESQGKKTGAQEKKITR